MEWGKVSVPHLGESLRADEMKGRSYLERCSHFPNSSSQWTDSTYNLIV